MKKTKLNIVTIGGGTGSFMLLSELKKRNDVNITAIVAMSDSGGSTGILRDQMGVLPAGDVRQCLTALSQKEEDLRKLFTFRYGEGSFLKGHTFGNIFLSTIEKIFGSFEKSVEEASKILNIRGKILPITLTNNDLVVEKENGEEIVGEGQIDKKNILNYKKIYLKGRPRLNVKVKKVIRNADIIIVAPGNFYNSIIPNFLVNGFAKEVKETKAKKFFIANLTTKNGHTNNFEVTDYIKELYKISGEKNFIDYVIYNKQKRINDKMLELYKENKSDPVIFNNINNLYSCQFIGDNLVSNQKTKIDKTDTVKRSLIRHDGQKLVDTIFNIYKRKSIYIFDFDHTLFNAKKFREDISKEIFNKKISSEEIWDEYINKNKDLLDFIKNMTKKYLFKDTEKILKNMDYKKYLLSFGNIGFQKTKIKASGIKKFFYKIFIVDKHKINFMKSFYKENKNNNIIFINDNYNKRFNENMDIKKEFPDIKILIVDKYKDMKR